MPRAWAGILCWQVVKKAGIFLLPPPYTHILHLFLHSMCFQPELLAQAFSLPGKSISGAQSVLLGQSHSLGMDEPGTEHSGSRVCCDLVGGCPLPGEGHHCCCGMWGCSSNSSNLGSKTLQGCRIHHIAPQQNAAGMPVCEMFCGSFPNAGCQWKGLHGGQNIFTIFQTSPWKSQESCQGMMAFLHHHSVTKPILLGIGVCQQLSSWCSSIAVRAMARRARG